MTVELSIIIPVLNERDNLVPMVERLSAALSDIKWEVIFVDDASRDGSREELIQLSQSNTRVRFLTRIGRQGLSSAAIEGLLSSSASCLAVMDGDLQHDETLLPVMMSKLRDEGYDLAMGSRFAEGAEVGEFSSLRQKMSNLGNRFAQRVIKADLTDPLSGFFMIRRDVFEENAHRLSGTGFKILIDILASSPHPLKVAELPFVFGQRQHGESKLDSLVIVEFLTLLIDKWLGHLIPVRFLFFTAVGSFGVIIHLLLLTSFYKFAAVSFYLAQAVATLITMAVNYSLNNLLTYRDRRLEGHAFFIGLISFYLVCSIGALANFQFADFLYRGQVHWIVAGVAGAVIGAVWNFAMTATFTWAKKNKKIS